MKNERSGMLGLFSKGFAEGMKRFGNGISAIVNSILLLIVYLLGVGLTSMFSKLARKHFLQKRISKKRESYWSDLNLKKRPVEEYYRQF